MTEIDRLKVVFMGSPDFAVPSLSAVAEHHDVRLVVTQPDRPRGRGRALAPPPVKVRAQALGIDVVQPEKLRTKQMLTALAAVGADVFVVVAYGKILSAKLLAIPRLGCINVHGSLLPKFRGAAPIQWAVLAGEAESGVTIMKLDEGMDTGPMLLSAAVPLAVDETAGSLYERLAPIGAALLVRALAGLRRRELVEVAQPADGASLAPMLRKEQGRVDFSRPAREVDCWIRGMDPWPGACTEFEGQVLKLKRSRVVVGYAGRPGEVLAADGRGLIIACGTDAVAVRELQLPGRRCMEAGQLLAGCCMPAGTIFGSSAATGPKDCGAGNA